MKTDFVRTRIDHSLKVNAHAVFEGLGVTPSQAIKMFYTFVQRERALPMALSLPNKATAKAIKEAREKKGVVSCKNRDEAFKKLGLKVSSGKSLKNKSLKAKN